MPESGSQADTVIIAGLYRFPDINAAATRALALANLLESSGKRVILVGFSADSASQLPVLNEKLSAKTGFDTYEIGATAKAKLMFKLSVHQLKPLLSAAPSKATALVLYNSGSLALLSALLHRRRAGYHLIHEITEWYVGSTARWWHSVVRRADTFLRMRVLNRYCDGLILSSQYLEQYYQSRVANRFVLPGLIDSEKSVAQFGEKLASPSLDSEHVRFCYAGEAFNKLHIDKQKSNIKDRLEVVIDLFFLLYTERQNWQFDIYGVTKSDFLDVFPEREEKLKTLSNHVKFHGRVNRAVILECYVVAHFSIFFRHSTVSNMAGFPTKLAESMMYGCPVITNPVEHSTHWVVDGHNGLVLDPGSEQSMVQTILDACDLPSHVVLRLKRDCQRTALLQAANYKAGLAGFMSKLV